MCRACVRVCVCSYHSVWGSRKLRTHIEEHTYALCNAGAVPRTSWQR